MNIKKALLLAIIAALIASYFVFDLGQYFSLGYIKEQQSAFDALYQDNPALILGGFFALYVIVTALSLPGAAIMTLAAGALFGFWIALALVSFASSAGATLAFLASRFLFHDTVQNRFGERLKKLNEGVQKRRRVLSFHIASGARCTVFHYQSGYGPHPHQSAHFLLGQPGGYAGRHRRLRECGHPTWPDRQPGWFTVTRVTGAPLCCWVFSRG